jgi:hypothetical protein
VKHLIAYRVPSGAVSEKTLAKLPEIARGLPNASTRTSAPARSVPRKHSAVSSNAST